MPLDRRTLLLSPLLLGCNKEPHKPAPPARLEHSTAGKKALQDVIGRLAPMHRPLPPPGPGDWLASHAEKGQSFEQYADGQAILPTEQRTTLVVQPLGELKPVQEKVISEVTDYLKAFFGLPARQEPPLTLEDTPPEARRETEGFGEQLLTPYLLGRVLAPRLPADAMAYLAFTARDLWPGRGWNYVFGEASLDARVGVWSLARYGDLEAPKSARRARLRALKIASHETGHMFGMDHCTTHLCNMAGVNSPRELDAHPTWLCAGCVAKLSWATRMHPSAHLSRMNAFAAAHQLPTEQAFYEASLQRLK